MANYVSQQEEVSRAIARIDQNFNFMFTLSIALIASQIAWSKFFAQADSHPIYYLSFAILGLWFPVCHILYSVDLLAAGLFIRTRLLPTLRQMVEASLESAVEDRQQSAARAAAMLDWESFRSTMLFRSRTAYVLMNALWFVKGGLLYLPSGLAILRYVNVYFGGHSLHRSPSSAEFVVGGILIALVVITQVANWCYANLPRIYRQTV